MTDRTFLIVGASLAGAGAAGALRKAGFDGRIVLIGEEPGRPYERPKLSKEYLRGEAETPKFVHEPDFYDEQGIELLAGVTAQRIDTADRQVVTTDGAFAYDALLIATGAAARRPDIPGVDLDGVVTLRTVGDADRIRERAAAAESVVVVGGGWIGAEVAASLRQLGRNVTLVLPSAAPLERVLGPEVAAIYARVHAEQGVSLAAGTRAVRFDGRDRVEAVVTSDGRRIAADLVVLGVGATPRTDLVAGTPIAVDNGILVDPCLQTSVPAVFAAGDVANALHPLYGQRIRLEHWDNAKRQGRAVAANMLGDSQPYDRIPYFYSDQFDLGMEYTGFAPTWDEVVFRGDPNGREFIAFWLKNGAVAAGMNVNVWDVAPAIERLVRSRAPVDRAALADPARPLEEVAAPA